MAFKGRTSTLTRGNTAPVEASGTDRRAPCPPGRHRRHRAQSPRSAFNHRQSILQVSYVRSPSSTQLAVRRPLSVICMPISTGRRRGSIIRLCPCQPTSLHRLCIALIQTITLPFARPRRIIGGQERRHWGRRVLFTGHRALPSTSHSLGQ